VPPTNIEQVKAIRALQTTVAPSGFWSALFFNVTRPQAGDLRVRQAIRLAVDRRAILDGVAGGNGVLQDAALSPEVPVVPTDIPLTPHDPQKARQILDAAGWHVGPHGIRGKNGRSLSLVLALRTGASQKLLGEILRKDLLAVGIALQVRHYPPPLLFASYGDNGVVMRGNWDMASFAWDSDTNGSLENAFACARVPPAGQNITRYCNRTLDVLLWRYTMTYDEPERRRLLEIVERKLVSDVPFVTLYAWKVGYTASPRLEGYQPSAMAPFGDPMQLDL
jgi:peptide/nickel transport system substrate-binding protein